MTLDDLNPSNTFELRLLEILKQGVPQSAGGIDDDVARTLVYVTKTLVTLQDEVTDLRQQIAAMRNAIIEGAGG